MIEKREKALLKIAMEEPEMCEVIKMLQENDMRNANATNAVAHALESVTDRTLGSLEKMSDTMNEMSNAIEMMGNKIVELEEKIKKLEGDNMDKTVKMCDNVVESIENGNDDDFLASYMELTAALKAEVQQDIENEKELYGDDNMEDVDNIYNEMVYGDSTNKILCDGQYNGIHYWILNVRGSHPCGYIEIPEDHEYYEEEYDDVYLPVHGGLTFSEDHLSGIVKDTWILGWDYGHYGDRTTFSGGKEHYVKDIIEEIKEAIDFLISV